MRDTFLAVDAATDLRAHARELRRRWDATFSGAPVTGQMRPVIARSWSRMTGAGLDPTHLRPRPALGPQELADARMASPLRHALPALRHHLGTIADDAEHVLVVCDAEGRILWLEGHPRVLDHAQNIDFRPGMLWTERSAGTNAIGTALAIDHPVQIYSAEHFLLDQHPWWCSAAPMHDPVTNDLLGVVDVSGPQRTAHPYSLTLVTAAARIAGSVLRERQIERDNRLRAAYLDRIRASRDTASALVDDRGRVLVPLPAARMPVTIPPPTEAGPMTLDAGLHVEAEPLDGGAWVLWASGGRPRGRRVGSRRLRVNLRLLGRHHHTVSIDGSSPERLTLRHAEALALLVLYPEGLTAEELTLQLYGERGKAVTTRALMSRLRTLMGGCLVARPYRLAAQVRADFVEVSTLLAAGETTRALARYRGPLLVTSEVERIVAARAELAGAVRRAALAVGGDALWAWIDSEDGRDDPAALTAFLACAGQDDARRHTAMLRLQALEPCTDR